jgi:8-oxo-dGTP pyrophosphatase MutT (NUDIX family)
VEKSSIKIEWGNMDLKAGKDRAAVMIILCEDGELKALYIRRAVNPMDPWSGQIAFPGGRTKMQDVDIIETAIREAWEEVGIEVKERGCHWNSRSIPTSQ